MWTQVAIIVLVTALTACQTHAQTVCGFPETIWRHGNKTCPDRAVCADVFSTRRDWMNGTTCSETRVLNNCLCPNNRACPVNDDNHRLYSTAMHKMYTCEPICTRPWCYSVSGTSEGRREPVIAMTVEEQSPEFYGNTYTRINCRCPRHHEPNRQPPGVQRAVRTYGYVRNPKTGHFASRHTCKVSGTEEFLADPCPRHSNY